MLKYFIRFEVTEDKKIFVNIFYIFKMRQQNHNKISLDSAIFKEKEIQHKKNL